jgi:TRAP transporter TAXI family solute receptor
MSPRHGWLLCVLLACLAVTGCTRGPDAAGLQSDVQARLDALFGDPRLQVESLRRQGSSPLPAAPDGTPRVIVYFNARLTFTGAYDPSDWQGLSPELIATALGATSAGVIGLGTGGPAAAGSTLRAYGSLVYQRREGVWTPASLPAVATGADRAGGADASEPVELIDRLARIVNTTPGLHRADERVVAEELDRALQNITLRLDRGQQGLVVATGPAGGEYARFVESLRPRTADWAVRAVHTDGSVANAVLVDAGEARFGIVQSDVAAAAVTGSGSFEGSGPLGRLRAVAALFPEPLHVVVRVDAPIASVADLAGRRVALGQRESGTRPLAQAVLRAYGLAADGYVAVDVASPGEALQMLADGRVDAVIEVVSAPWQQLGQVAASEPLRLLPLSPEAIGALDGTVPGLLHLAIAARTYPGQEAAVQTVGATALLLANSDVPDAAVHRVLEFLFESEVAAARGVAAARLSRERARLGVTLPLHDGAARFFAESAVVQP